MKELATYSGPAFLGDHPPILATMLIEGDGAEKTIPAGSVLGRDSQGRLGPWSDDFCDAAGVLAGDVTVRAGEDAVCEVYIHASVVASELVFDAALDGEEIRNALAALRLKGIYSDVTWAPAAIAPANLQASQENSNNGGGE